MKRITYALMGTLTALVLLFGYRTSTSSQSANSATVVVTPIQAGTTSTASGTSSSAGSPPTGTTGTAAAPSTSTTSSTASAAKTVTGIAADTRYGPVQVQLTVQNGKITKVAVVQYPNNDGRDQEINANALPILIDETLKAQNATIDMVSGATYTSQGYLTSLQSAMDEAGL